MKRSRRIVPLFLSLPNPHPWLVHFPIALCAAALGFDLACLIWRREIWLDRAAVALYFVGTVSAGAAAVTGKLAAVSFESLPAETETLVGEHGEWAFFTVVLFLVLSLLRAETAWRDRGESSLRRHRLRLLALAVALSAQGALLQTAARGAALVYRHGVGVNGMLR